MQMFSLSTQVSSGRQAIPLSVNPCRNKTFQSFQFFGCHEDGTYFFAFTPVADELGVVKALSIAMAIIDDVATDDD